MESGRGGGREEGIRVIALLPTVCVSRITTAASTNKLEHALATSVMEFGRVRTSALPSSAAMKGLENIRSIFAVFSA